MQPRAVSAGAKDAAIAWAVGSFLSHCSGVSRRSSKSESDAVAVTVRCAVPVQAALLSAVVTHFC